MDKIINSRRSFLTGFVGILAAPAIVRASILMAVRPFDDLNSDFGMFDLEKMIGILRANSLKPMIIDGQQFFVVLS